jgi:hypothetical protein
MKTTQERLSEVYCKPKTVDEWRQVSGYTVDEGDYNNAVYDAEIGVIDALDSEIDGLTEIPVSYFIDLLKDSIVQWRLEEDGFDIQEGITYFETVAGSFRIEADGDVSHIVTGRTANVDTYTDLLTLIRLIG